MHNAPNWNSFAHLYAYRKAAHSHYTRSLTNFNRDTHVQLAARPFPHFQSIRFWLQSLSHRAQSKADKRETRSVQCKPPISQLSGYRGEGRCYAPIPLETCRSSVSRLTGTARKWEASRMCSFHSVQSKCIEETCKYEEIYSPTGNERSYFV